MGYVIKSENISVRTFETLVAAAGVEHIQL